MISDTNFAGRSGFYWWQGVVEDRIDPEKLGRLKIRIFGSHSKDKSFVKTEDLHWAYPIQSLTSAAKNGLGNSPTGPLPGTWVFGFYHDADDMQEPIVLGTMSGVPQDAPNNAIGFNDPRDSEGTPEKLINAPRKILTRVYKKDGTGSILTPESKASSYPRESHPLGCIIGESDTNRIARAEKINDTILQVISDNIDTLVPIAFGGTWNEPNIWYNGAYPFVHVYESESGHITVTDDTPHYEGALQWDRTGTFTQIQTDGSKIEKIVSDNYTIILKDNHIHVMGNEHERVDHRLSISVGGNWDVEVKGNINITSHQNINVVCDGDMSVKVAGSLDVEVAGNTTAKCQGNLAVQSGANADIRTAGSMEINCGGIFDVHAADIIFNGRSELLPE